MAQYTSIAEQIEFGLSEIDPKLKTEISVKDLMYVYKTMEQLNSFFHQPMHYPTIEDVEKFIGNKNEGAYQAISKCYYKILWEYLPKDIQEKIENSESFENPTNPPYLNKEK